MKTLLRRTVKWLLFGLPMTGMVVFGFVFLFPFFALMDWLEDKPEPINGAWNHMMTDARDIFGELSA